jgi:hypothetical protein
MTLEQDLYDKFVQVLSKELEAETVSPKSLDVVQKFIAQQGIQSSTARNKGLNELANKAMGLPFEDDEELPPIKRVK